MNTAAGITLIQQNLVSNGLVILEQGSNAICAQVNGLTAFWLTKLGHIELARDIMRAALHSPLYDPATHLFHREISTAGVITRPEYNVCKNACMGLGLAAAGFLKEAEELRAALYANPAFNENRGVFFREFKRDIVNTLILTQTNLLMCLLDISLGHRESANKLYNAIKHMKFSEEYHLFSSQDCEKSTSATQVFYTDDQAIAIIASYQLGISDYAMISASLDTYLRDPVSGLFYHNFDAVGTIDKRMTSYKNGWCGIALATIRNTTLLDPLRVGLRAVLFNKASGLFNFSATDTRHIADNCVLALTALSGKPASL